MFVSAFSAWTSSAFELYKSAKNLLDESKKDPPDDPYRSKYQARKILTQLQVELRRWEGNGTLQVRLLSALFQYELGVIGIETEERSAGCSILTDVSQEIGDICEIPECCLLTLNVLNQLGLLWSERGEIQKSLSYFQDAESLCRNYKVKYSSCPYEFDDLFTMSNSTDKWDSFEKSLTHTMYYLAQVYELLNENDMSAKYCRETLKRQRESGTFKPIEWATNCATLSQYFVQKRMFQEARHLLSCSTFVLFRYEIIIDDDEEENKDARTEVQRSKALLSCFWMKYGIFLMADPGSATEGTEVVPDAPLCPLMKNEEVLHMEKRIPCSITSYGDVKILFVFCQNHASLAQDFFTLNEYANSYAQVVQDHSKLYKRLACHDPDLSRQCKMHKRRLDMLEELLSKLNPQFYLAVCRRLQFELGEICHEMIDLKKRISNACREGLSVKVVSKINSLIMKGIDHFQSFIYTMKEKDGNLPEVFSDDLVRPALIAHFYVGKYYSNLTEVDTNKQLHNLSKTEEYYKFIVDYSKRNKDHASYVEKELPVIEEMLELMPEKMSRIRNTTRY